MKFVRMMPTINLLSIKYLRSLSVAKKSLLLLELLDLLIITRVGNQMVDGEKSSLGWNLESGILLSDTIPTNVERRVSSWCWRVWSSSLDGT